MYNSIKLVIEGPDNVGKTSQINNIIKHFKVPFQCLHYYSNPIKNDKYDSINLDNKIYNTMFDIINDTDYIICDRSHIGSSIYNPLYRGYSGDYVFDIEKSRINDENEMFLFLFVDDIKNLIDRDDGLSHSINEKNIREEINLFKIGFDKSIIKNKLIIDINNKNEQEVTKIIIDFINKTKGQE